MYNDYWMIDNGFIKREQFGDLRDLIARRHWENATVTITPGEMVQMAYRRMKLYDISQIPVLEDGQLVGILDESDLLTALIEDKDAFNREVRSVMTQNVETVDLKTPIEALPAIFQNGKVVVVTEKGKFMGLITKIDLIHYLRQKAGQ
ncbi:MAG: CBS domain-containing protein, partial [Proteobacteria bacterium]